MSKRVHGRPSGLDPREAAGERFADALSPSVGDEAPLGRAGELDEQWARGLAGAGELSDADNEALIALSVGEDVCRPSAREQQCAAELAERIDGRARPSQRRAGSGHDRSGEGGDRELDPLLELATALRAAACLDSLDELTNERLVQAAVRPAVAAARGRGRWLTAGALAAAAAVALWWAAGPALRPDGLQASRGEPGAAAAVQLANGTLIPVRSTQPLFDSATRFPVRGGESERLDRIAAARTTDLRANRYATWGVP